MDKDRPFIPIYMYEVAVALMKVFITLEENEKDHGTSAVLVFLPGIVEIDNMSKFLQRDKYVLTHSLLLYSVQPPDTGLALYLAVYTAGRESVCRSTYLHVTTWLML